MKNRPGILTAFLRLNDTQFGRGLKRQRARIAAFAGFVKRVLAPLAVLAAGVGTIRGVGQTLAHVDAQAKLARSLNTSVESMQVMQRAGELAGVEQAKLAQGSKDLHRRLSQAATGSGASAKALGRLKLSANDLLKLPLDQRISTINAALKEYVPAAERAAVAGALFGEEGSIAMTRLDPATLRQAAEEVQKFGRAISDVEAAKIEQANDALSRVGLVVRGIGTDLTIALAPILDAGARLLASWVTAWRNIRAGVGDAIVLIRSLVSWLFEGSDATEYLSSKIDGAFQAISRFFGGVRRLLGGLRALVEQSGGFGVVWEHIKAIAAEVGGRIGTIFKAMALRVRGSFESMASRAASGLAQIIQNATNWAARMTDIAIGAKDAMVAAFKSLPTAVGSLMYEAANTTIAGVETLINGVVKRINALISTVNAAIARLPDWARGTFTGLSEISAVDLGGVANPYAGAERPGAAAAAAFRRAQGQTDFGTAGAGLLDAADRLLGRATGSRAAAALLEAEARAPIEAVGKLRKAISEANETADAAAETNTKLATTLDDVADSGGGAARSLGSGVARAAKKAVEELKPLSDRIKSLADALAAASFQSKSWGDVLIESFRRVAQAWLSQGIQGILTTLAGGAGGGGLFGRLLNAFLPGRAMGGGVRAGAIYRVNEQTPRSEWMFAGPSGGILNHGQMRAAVASAVGQPQAGGETRILVGFDRHLIAEILDDANHGAVEIAQGIVGRSFKSARRSSETS